jgi:hypothetical protein
MNEDYERQLTPITPEIQAAIDELKGMIAERFPDAVFDVREQYEPPGISLTATVDIEDTDEVFEIVVDRIIELQVYERIPVYVTPLRPIERVMEEIRKQAEHAPWLRPYVEAATTRS